MSNLFQPWEKASVRQVEDYYENHFLKSIFKIIAWRKQPRVIDAFEIPERQEEGILAQLNVFDDVTKKGLTDNPAKTDQEKIVEKAQAALRICMEKVEAKFGKMEPARVAKIQKRVDEVRPHLP